MALYPRTEFIMYSAQSEALLDSAACLWSTLINVMRTFSANAVATTGIAFATGIARPARNAGAISIPAIRISRHNQRAGIGA